MHPGIRFPPVSIPKTLDKFLKILNNIPSLPMLSFAIVHPPSLLFITPSLPYNSKPFYAYARFRVLLIVRPITPKTHRIIFTFSLFQFHRHWLMNCYNDCYILCIRIIILRSGFARRSRIQKDAELSRIDVRRVKDLRWRQVPTHSSYLYPIECESYLKFANLNWNALSFSLSSISVYTC